MNKSIRITPVRLILLSIGFFGTNFFWGFNSATMPLFVKNFTDSKFRISLILSMAGAVSCIVPPLVGYFSDRSFSRFGRRKPYILGGGLGLMLCVLGLSHASAFGIVALVSAPMYLFIVFAETPYMSLLPDATPAEQRSTASGVMNLFGSIGLIAYFLIGSRIWDINPAAVFYMVALVPLGFLLITITFLKEPEVPMDKPASGRNPLAYLKGLAKETNVLKFFIGQSFWWLGLWVVSSFLTLFVVEELKASEGDSMLVPMVFSIVATVFMLPLGMLGDRLGRKGILTCMIAFWAVANVLIGLSQNLTHALITLGIAGIPYAAAVGVGYAYLLDLIPEERTAEFVGFNIVSITMPQILGPLVGGKLIDMMGYRSIFPAAAAFTVIGLIILQFVRPREVTETPAEN